MKSVITALCLLISLTLFAETVWLRPDGTETKRIPASLQINGKFHFDPTTNQLIEAGWIPREYELADVVVTSTVSIAVYGSALFYQGFLEQMSAGSSTDTNTTFETVAPIILQDASIPFEKKDALLAAYERMRSWMDDNGRAGAHLAYFPYGEWSVLTTNKMRILVE